MNHRRTVLAAALLGILLSGAPGARAAGPVPVTADQAKALQTSLTHWLVATLGPDVKLPPDLFTVAPAGRDYRIGVASPLFTAQGASGPAPAHFSVDAHPLANGSWAFGDLRMPPSFTFAPPAKPIPAGGPGFSFTFSYGNFAEHGVIDPSLTRPSFLVSTGDDLVYSITATTPAGATHQRATLDRVQGFARLVPAAGGLVNAVSAGTGWGYRVVGTGPKGEAYTASVARVDTHSSISGVAPAAWSKLAQAALAAARAAKAAPAAPAPGAPNPAAQAVVGALQGLFSGISVSEELDGFRLKSGGKVPMSFSIAHMAMGFGGDAPQNMLSLHLTLVVDGLHSSLIPPAFAKLVPSHFVLHPTLTGVDLAALTKAAVSSATTPGAGPQMMMPAMMAMLSAGTVKAALNGLELDIGPARLRAHGRLHVLNMGQAAGGLVIIVSHYGALAKLIAGMPQGAQAAPMLALARSIARPAGARLVWVVRRDPAGKVTVNGKDLASLAPPPPPGAAPVPAPAPQQGN